MEGEKYFVVYGELENLASGAVDIAHAGEAEILINGKDKLPATMKLEESDGISFYGSAEPSQTLPLVIFASVPDEIPRPGWTWVL